MNHAAISYRAMKANDVDTVLALECEVSAAPWTRGNFLDCLNSGYHCQLILKNNKPVGHSVLSVAAGEAHLLIISIRADQQGQGLGRQLLGHMLNYATRAGASSLFLEVRASNHVAQSLYQRQGFKEIGRRPGYYPGAQGREDAVVMALELNTKNEALSNQEKIDA